MRLAASWILWPLLVAISCAITAAGLRHGVNGSLILAGVYFTLALALGSLERVLPFERQWVRSDGQVTHDVVFTLVGTSLPGTLADSFVLACTVGVAQWLARHVGGSLWPHVWPAAAQIALVVLVGDFGAYWGHRSFHNVSWMWPYHAVHHSVSRLWYLNTGRIHPVDSALMMAFSMAPLYLLGAPDDMVVWLFSFTTFIGMLSHCNVNMRCGPLDWLFCTPGVHRWHHSRVLTESNNNYGEITMVWDVLFRTHYRQQRRPPCDIGTSTPIPSDILGQFVAPLRLSWQAATDSPAPSARARKMLRYANLRDNPLVPLLPSRQQPVSCETSCGPWISALPSNALFASRGHRPLLTISGVPAESGSSAESSIAPHADA